MYHILINPASRSGKARAIWEKQLEPLLQKEGISFQAYFSEKPGDITRLAAEITAAQRDVGTKSQTLQAMTDSEKTQTSPATADAEKINLLIMGGDGTMNEALQGIADFSRITLGCIPTGSSNDLLRHLKISRSPKKALLHLVHQATPHASDLGTLTLSDGTSRRFLVSCGFGFDAAVCEGVARSDLKKRLNKLGLGKLVYLGIALQQLLGAKGCPITLTLDNSEPMEISRLLFVATMIHSYEGGGFLFCPGADATDGSFDLCVVGNIPKALILCALPTAFFGKHTLFSGINLYKAKKVRIQSKIPLWVHTDGEVLTKATDMKICCEQQKIFLLY